MAGLAFGRYVSPSQWIARMQVVVECNGLPVTLPVARFAFLPIRSLMFVVLLVTGVAIQWRVLKCRCEVTLLALHSGVFSHQREARLIVVERRLLP